MSAVLTVKVGAGSARAELTRGAQVVWAAEAAFTGPDELRETMAQLTAGEAMPARPRRLLVTLDAPMAQVRTLHDLPPVRGRHLKALVASQAGRFFRRNGKVLVTDAAWAGGRRGAPAVAAAAEEPWIDAILSGASAGGVPVESIRPAAAPPGSRLELLSAGERRRRRRIERVALGRVAMLAVLAWTAAAAVWAVRLERARREVEREIERLRSPVEAVASARRALGAAAELVDSVEAATRERSRVLTQLAALSAALPDSAYATSLALDGHGGELAVVARRSAEVTAALDPVGAIAAPRIEGTVVRETAGGREWERFALRFDAGAAATLGRTP